jgi:hypothetical protein
VSKGKLSDNELDSGLCVLVYAANLAQSPGPELTNSLPYLFSEASRIFSLF